MYLRIHSIRVTVVQSAPKFISDNINAYPFLLGGITTVGGRGQSYKGAVKLLRLETVTS